MMCEWERGFMVKGQRIKDKGQSESEWEDVGFVRGNGTTNSPKNYEFTDSELPNSESVDYRLKQIDNDGTFAFSKTVTVDLTTITAVEDEVIYEFALEQNYPNPFNPSTTIKFTIFQDVRREMQDVKLIVFDMLGRTVEVLVDGVMNAGYHEVVFNASNLTSGMYLNRISIGNEFNSVRKMKLVK